MWKILRKTTTVKKEDGTVKSIQDSHLDRHVHDTRRMLLRLMFALASVVKVTPKRLATAYAKDSKEYAAKFQAELGKVHDKPVKDLEKKLRVGVKKLV